MNDINIFNKFFCLYYWKKSKIFKSYSCLYVLGVLKPNQLYTCNLNVFF